MSGGEKDKESSGLFAGHYFPLSSADPVIGDGDKAAMDSHRVRSRMPLEGHTTVLPSEGGVIVFQGSIPQGWDLTPDAASFANLGRNIVFAGERMHILVHITPVDPSVTELVAPEPSVEFVKVESPSNISIGEHRRTKSFSSVVKSVIALKRFGATTRDDEIVGKSSSPLVEDKPGKRVQGPSLSRSLPLSKTLSVEPGLQRVSSSAGRDGHERRSRLLFERAQRSHYFVRISDPTSATQLGQQDYIRTTSGSAPVSSSFRFDANGLGGGGGIGNGEEKPSPQVPTRLGRYGCTPMTMESSQFDPLTGGGLARQVIAVRALENGDVAVLLEVCIETNVLTRDAVLEVLQYERIEKFSQETDDILTTPLNSPLPSPCIQIGKGLNSQNIGPMSQLQQWLLPLDKLPAQANAPPSTVSQSTSWATSHSFSFASSSPSPFSLSLSRLPSPPVTQSPPISPSPSINISSLATFSDLDLVGAQRDMGVVGSEGLLSFRTSNLEPQRFAGQCGLNGCYVPGRRWLRPVSVLQPLLVESHIAECNMQDLVCVLIENILPKDEGETSDMVIYIDNISMECRPQNKCQGPLPVHMAPVESGDGQDQLPGLMLRPGEQHSFVLRPSQTAMTVPSSSGTPPGKPQKYFNNGPQSNNYSRLEALSEESERKKKDSNEGSEETNEWEYSLVVACSCSYSDSRLHYRHPLTWQPRPRRDLLLSVKLDEPSSPPSSQISSGHFAPQMVTVSATNLTSSELNLTLLAPSSLATTALSRLSFPRSPRGSFKEVTVMGTFEDQSEGHSTAEQHALFSKALSKVEGQSLKVKAEEEGEKDDRLESLGSKKMLRSATSFVRQPSGAVLSRIISLPPVRRMESLLGIPSATLETLRLQTTGVAERSTSAADLVAEQLYDRSHLWLQSVVPIGRVPPNGTAEVQCELLPLTDGIITLDTLHVATKRRDMLFIPEHPLQVYKSMNTPSQTQAKFSKLSAYADFGIGVNLIKK